MGIISWIIFGLIAGVLAKWLLPGKDPGGFVVTVLLGIAGAMVGGYVGTHLKLGTTGGFTLEGLLVAVAGAILVLAIYRFVAKKIL